MSDNSTKKHVIEPIIYADMFDCALSLSEIHRYNSVRIDQTKLTSELNQYIDRGIIDHHDGYYFLSGKKALTKDRAERINRADHLHNKGKKIATMLRYVPYVKGILLTGSVAAGDAKKDADIDYLFIVKHNRIASVFLILAPIARITGHTWLCPNYYISEKCLKIKTENYYTGREILQSIPVGGDANLFHEKNEWVEKFFPNTSVSRPKINSIHPTIFEIALNYVAGDLLEKLAKKIARKRLHAHFSKLNQSAPEELLVNLKEGRELRFHAIHNSNELLNQFNTKKNRILG